MCEAGEEGERQRVRGHGPESLTHYKRKRAWGLEATGWHQPHTLFIHGASKRAQGWELHRTAPLAQEAQCFAVQTRPRAPPLST